MRSDEDLMQAYAEGDERAFDEIYRRYRPVLLGVMRRYIPSSTDVEDLVQLTFLKLHRAKASYKSGTPVRPWLFTIARNTRKDHLRSSRRNLEREGDVDTFGTFNDPSCKLERAEQIADLWAGLHKLSATLRRTIEQHWIDDLAFAEIAKMEGILSGTARVRAHRGCAQLRAWMSQPVLVAKVA